MGRGSDPETTAGDSADGLVVRMAFHMFEERGWLASGDDGSGRIASPLGDGPASPKGRLLSSVFCVAGAGSTTLPIYIFSSIRMGISPKINAISTIMLMISIAFVALSYYIGQRKR